MKWFKSKESEEFWSYTLLVFLIGWAIGLGCGIIIRIAFENNWI